VLRHTLILIYRNFIKFKSTFFINLIGLSTGLACALLIYLWIDDELHVDKFFSGDDRLYQVLENKQTSAGIQTTIRTPQILADRLAEEYPDIQYAAVVTPYQWFPKFTLSIKDKIIKAEGKFAGKDFFHVFSYQLVQGSPNTSLADINSIAISETLARKLFNKTTDVQGKTITWKIAGIEKQATVSGIFKDVPSTATDQFEFVLSFDILRQIMELDMNYYDYGPNTYLLLKQNADADLLSQKIADFIKRKDKDQQDRTLFLARYSDNYLYSNYENGVQTGGRIVYVKLSGLIAVFILIIACINFMNLSTAKASARLKDIGIRKAIGANRSALVLQFFTESLMMSLFSLLLAVLLVDIMLGPFNAVVGKNLVLDIHYISDFTIIAAVTGLIAGIYPALYLSGFKPVKVLKGKLSNPVGELMARKVLVVFQFTLSIIFIVSVIVIYQQTNYIQHRDIGFNKDNIVMFEPGPANAQQVEAMINELKNTSGIVNASSMWNNLVGGYKNMTVPWNGSTYPFAGIDANHNFLELLDVRFVEGRSFSQDFPSDTSAVIFNKKAISLLGIQDPINKIIDFQGEKLQIIGITEDFHFESFYTPVKPLAIRLYPDRSWTIIAKLEAGKEKEALAKLTKIYQSYNPGMSFEYRFLDYDFQQQYAAESRTSSLSKYFATLAIIISCLGLLGLAAFTAERRRKEIGIRKVLGSQPSQIVLLLTREFSILVSIALCVGIPLSYFITKNWLDRFAYRVDLELWYFGVSAIVAFAIAWCTVGLQAYMASQINPAEILKEE
jgi:putative ABC transport system permease protein